MSARGEFEYAMESAFGIEPKEYAAFLDTYRAEVLREAADAIQGERAGFLNPDVSDGLGIARVILNEMADEGEQGWVPRRVKTKN